MSLITTAEGLILASVGVASICIWRTIVRVFISFGKAPPLIGRTYIPGLRAQDKPPAVSLLRIEYLPCDAYRSSKSSSPKSNISAGPCRYEARRAHYELWSAESDKFDSRRGRQTRLFFRQPMCKMALWSSKPCRNVRDAPTTPYSPVHLDGDPRFARSRRRLAKQS
ncbi:hypothetical protein BJ170DRAFT_329094 [Xylariales sp. AK1849]|nr:hypothetical protein BJ170DRAFT_329094 [Xylariales sp. AK1849]